mmetsp:Transcript_16447/g.40489  ORF Transcript_16447/g.40489 Transcript_16447/m.40489 type:complete len:148 (-) Transcript_16447:409-852(-)|eukprot:CAMPEP_0181352042 /NCGR_PEP_ID=MMETSP1106-20121128/2100_1 /TAXON_ID=81844 /ORGANISM="Mantoniella antarctica, Strain SL-175" /LENGTH=147 /DNA_ID=CAMNT_0023464579 /DNA_START=146 /DNA_END=589 /DNA_ORIENTATION=+
MSFIYTSVKFAFALGMFLSGIMKLTDTLSAEVHRELVTQLDAFAVEPWGFLGLSGEDFRRSIGWTEVLGAVATLIPWQPMRTAAQLLLVVLLHAAWGTHMKVEDDKGLPALVFAGMGMLLLTGGKGKLAQPAPALATQPTAGAKKED